MDGLWSLLSVCAAKHPLCSLGLGDGEVPEEQRYIKVRQVHCSHGGMIVSFHAFSRASSGRGGWLRSTSFYPSGRAGDVWEWGAGDPFCCDAMAMTCAGKGCPAPSALWYIRSRGLAARR